MLAGHAWSFQVTWGGHTACHLVRDSGLSSENPYGPRGTCDQPQRPVGRAPSSPGASPAAPGGGGGRPGAASGGPRAASRSRGRRAACRTGARSASPGPGTRPGRTACRGDSGGPGRSRQQRTGLTDPTGAGAPGAPCCFQAAVRNRRVRSESSAHWGRVVLFSRGNNGRQGSDVVLKKTHRGRQARGGARCHQTSPVTRGRKSKPQRVAASRLLEWLLGTLSKRERDRDHKARSWRTGDPPAPSVGRGQARPLWTAVWRVLKRSKVDLPRDPAVPLLGMSPRELKAGTGRGTGTRRSPRPEAGSSPSAHRQTRTHKT